MPARAAGRARIALLAALVTLSAVACSAFTVMPTFARTPAPARTWRMRLRSGR